MLAERTEEQPTLTKTANAIREVAFGLRKDVKNTEYESESDRSTYQRFEGRLKNAEKRLGDVNKRFKKRLEGMFAILCFLVGVFFLSSNLTGEVIASLNQTSSNWIGGILFVVGLIGILFFLKEIK